MDRVGQGGDADFLGRFRFAIFDMDGVLLDTEPLYTVAFDRVLSPLGHRLEPALKREIMGRRVHQSVAHVIETLRLEIDVRAFLARLEPELLALFWTAPACRGARCFVEQLAGRGVRMAIATSTIRPLFEVKTSSHPWFAAFEVVVCGDDPDVLAPKPAPDIFEAAARRLGVSPSECLIFEDSPLGILAARAAGGVVVAVVHPSETDPRFDLAHLRIGDLADLQNAASTAVVSE